MTEFNEILESIRKAYRLKKGEMAQLMGVVPKQYYRYTLGNSPGADKLLNLLGALQKLDPTKHINPAFLLTGQGEMWSFGRNQNGDGRFALVPKLTVLPSAGQGTQVLTDEDVDEYMPYPSELLHDQLDLSVDDVYCYQTNGDSMSPIINDGDYLLVNPKDVHVQDGKIYIFGLQDIVYCKYLYRTGEEMFEARSENPKYPPIQISREAVSEGRFRVIARVIHHSGVI